MTLIEVAVSGALLALFLLAIADFTLFSSKTNKSNSSTSDFATMISTIDNLIKTPACNALFGGIPITPAAGIGSLSTTYPTGLNSTMGFTLASPTASNPKPLQGFAFGSGQSASSPAAFKLTMIAKALETINVTTPIPRSFELDTFDFQLNLQKVDSTGKAMPGASLQTKDFILNLWVDKNLNQTVSVVNGGTCTYKRQDTMAPQIAPACLTPGQPFTVTWPQLVGASPILSANYPGWQTGASPAISTLPPTTNTITLIAPSGYPSIQVGVAEKDTTTVVGNTSGTAWSTLTGVHPSPTVAASFAPSVFSALGSSTSPVFSWTTNDPTNTIYVTGPGVTASPMPSGSSGTAVLTQGFAPVSDPQFLNYSINSMNLCGVQNVAQATVEYYTPKPSSTTPSGPPTGPTGSPTPSPSLGPGCTLVAGSPGSVTGQLTTINDYPGNGNAPGPCLTDSNYYEWKAPAEGQYRTANSGDHSGVTEPAINCLNYSLSVPANATINGVQAKFIVLGDNGGNEGAMLQTVTLQSGGGTIATKSPNSQVPGNYETPPQIFGGPTDLWGTSITADMVNDPSFGFGATMLRGNNRLFYDAQSGDNSMTVWYTSNTVVCASPSPSGPTGPSPSSPPPSPSASTTCLANGNEFIPIYRGGGPPACGPTLPQFTCTSFATGLTLYGLACQVNCCSSSSHSIPAVAGAPSCVGNVFSQVCGP